MGEGFGEVLSVLDDLRAAGCAYITIGQYLQPTPDQLPVHGFIPPGVFARYREECLRRGFKRADCGPLVRSSYHAASPDHPGGVGASANCRRHHPGEASMVGQTPGAYPR